MTGESGRGRRWRKALRTYQRGRDTSKRDSVCNAPLTNLYLAVDGQAAPCWLYWPDPPLVWGPERSLLDLWRSAALVELRQAHRRAEFPSGCGTCRHHIATGNRPLAAAYDNDRPIGDFPTMLELELSNLCNLECTMCSGRLSSRIRKNRDKLPPLASPYDDSFVEQVSDFLPHLHELRFNGGEPLLQPIVYAITDRVAELRPDLHVTIATNGTVMNAKVQRLLERCNVHVNISIDSLVPGRYEAIRVNAHLDQTLANFEIFRTYCQDSDRTLCVMVNPMRSNWDEMAEFVRWCNEKGVHLWFNTIRYPEDLALHTLPRTELERIQHKLAVEPLPLAAAGPAGDIQRHNLDVFDRFVHTQLATWAEEAGAAAVSRPVPVSLRGSTHREV